MLSLVKRIEEILNIKAVPEVSDSSGLRLMFDDGGVPIESAIMLYALVKLQKSKNILELGLYSAISTIFMAQAVKENGLGHIDSFEINDFHIQRSKDRLSKLELIDFVTIHNQSSLEYQPSKQYDFILSDTEPSLRFQEVIKYFPFLTNGGYLVIHDLFGHLGQGGPINPDHPDIPNWPFGTLPEEIKNWLKEDKLRVMPLPDTRGMCLFYKPAKEDYAVK